MRQIFGRSPRSFTRQATSMSATPTTPREMVDRLDARHEELMEKLDALNARIEQTLAECLRARAAASRDDEPVRKAA
jgi:hypothetical protein